MRAVVQRVSRARVLVGEEPVGAIERGLLVLLGVGEDDGPEDARRIAEKIGGLRVFEDAEGKMNRSVSEVAGEVLVVSQFTLWGDCRKGRRPSFAHAAGPERAADLYREVVRALEAAGLRTARGRFGAKMAVELVNDGPVTLLLDSTGAF